MHLSREKVGIIFGIAAVACLSSVIVRWAQHDPLEQHSWGHPLFGDLAEDDGTFPQPDPSDLIAVTDAGMLDQATEELLLISHAEAERSDFSTQDDPGDGSLITFARFTEPESVGSSRHQAPEQPFPVLQGAVWLSGGIEAGASEESDVPLPFAGIIEVKATTFEE